MPQNGYGCINQRPIWQLVGFPLATKEDRDHWVAGGKRQIIDLKTKKVVAEAIGYVMPKDSYYFDHTAWNITPHFLYYLSYVMKSF